MRLWEIFRFEVGHQLRQPSTWFYLVLLLGVSVLRADSADVGIVHYHAPVMAAYSALLAGVLGTLVTAGLFVEAGHRDARWRMDPLFYTVPLRRWDYLGGRFLGALLINAFLLLAVPAGLLLGTRLPTVSPETLGAFRVEAYLLPYLLFLLPNLAVTAAVLFGITVLSRRSLPGYLGALGLAAAYLYTGLRAGGDSSRVAALLDPTGAVAFSIQTAGFTRVELNTRLIELEGLLLWNRLLWALLAAGVLLFVYWRFRLGYVGEGPRRRRAPWPDSKPAPAPHAPVHARPVVVPPSPRSFGTATRARQMLAVARIGFRQTVLGRDFLLIAMGLAIFALLIVMQMVMSGTPLWPLTHEVAADLTGRTMRILIALLTVFYAGELVWRERDAGIANIDDSAPVPDWVLFAGKFLALGLTLVVLQAVLMASGMLAQALQGYYAFEPRLYLQILFGLQLADYLLFAVLALLVHVLVNHKYLGHMVAVLLFVATAFSRQLGIDHNLLVYGSDPGWVYSDLNGFGPFFEPFLWFKLYWAAWALLLGSVALLFWVRGTEGGLRGRMRLVRRRFTPRVAAGTAGAALLVLTTGGFVFYNTNVLNDYRTAWEAEEIYAEYERRYKRFEHVPQLRLSGMRLHAELYPERYEATVRGVYWLVNRTDEPIDSVHLSSLRYPETMLHRVRFDRPAEPVLEDEEHGYHIYALERAVQPGDSVQMHFELGVARRGFPHRQQISRNLTIIGEFTNLGSWVLPAIGYQREQMELSSARIRREHGLAPSELRPSIHDLRARRIPRIPRIRFEGTVGTTGDQIAVLPGTLQRSWTQGDRRYFHYRAEAPILNFFALLAAEYRVRSATWHSPAGGPGQSVEIRVLHHPDHSYNVDRLVRSAQAALDYYTTQFGPYPYRQLLMVEDPRYGDLNSARAYPGLVVYSEASSLVLDRMGAGGADRIDLPLLGTAHEVAHQWWGQQVMGADVQGSQMLSETLAQYSSGMVLERTHGPEQARQFLRTMHLRYLNGRGRNEAPEAPLLLTTDHAYLFYGKGPVVMYALQDYIGEERVNTALRRLVEKHAFRGPPYAITVDLYEELQAVTPDSLQSLLEDLLATITLWDLRATGAHAEPTDGGEFRVTLEVEATKLRSDSIGNDTEVPMDDLVEIGVFAAAEDGEGIGERLYLRKHRVLSGKQTITVTVPGKPARAGIDPYHKLIVRHPDALYRSGIKIAEVTLDGLWGSVSSASTTRP